MPQRREGESEKVSRFPAQLFGKAREKKKQPQILTSFLAVDFAGVEESFFPLLPLHGHFEKKAERLFHALK